MNANLYKLLIDKIEDFLNSDERNNDAKFYVGEKTVEYMAKAVENIYDAMAYADKLSQREGEE